MEILALLAALFGLYAAANRGDSGNGGDDDPVDDSEDPVNEDDEDGEEDAEEDETEESDDDPVEGSAPALDIVFNIAGDVHQAVIDAAAAAEERMEQLFMTAEEAGSQRSLDITLDEGEIDGAGGTAGTGTVLSLYPDNVPQDSAVRIDSADTERMISIGTLDEVMEHEVLHALGFGLTWDRQGLIETDGNGDRVFTGENATEEYAELMELDAVPDGIPLSSDEAHWDAEAFDRDTMEPTVYPDSDLSEVTIAALDDMGLPIDDEHYDADDEELVALAHFEDQQEDDESGDEDFGGFGGGIFL